MDKNQYLNIFIEEASENLQNLNQSLLELENNPENISILDSIFRIAHTLKGMSATMGFNRMSGLTHVMEDVLQGIKDGKVKVTEEIINLLFNSFDALDGYVKSIIDTGDEGDDDNTDLINVLRNVLSSGKLSEVAGNTRKNDEQGISQSKINVDAFTQNAINKAREMDMNAYEITVHLDKGCVLKSARAFVIFKTLEMYSDIIKSEPSVTDIEDEKFEFSFTVIVISKYDRDFIEKELSKITEVEKVEVNSLEKTGEMLVKTAKADLKTTTASKHTLDTGARQADKTPSKNIRTNKTVRVDIERLDVLLNLVGELIIQKSRLEDVYKDVSKDKNQVQVYEETLKHLERIINSLQDAVMKVRMVPVEVVFNRFPRMIRDLSKELGKEIVLSMSGEDTELDRTVIDEISEPLVHILRNAADHGIEKPEKRLELGKPEQGHINMRAYQEGNNVVIEIEDDGQGINFEKLKKSAVEKGLATAEQVHNATEKQLLDLLFLPSMSTADTISDISGRGVGLDVVKTKIESLSGTIDIETEVGKGTKFIIRLPLTLAMIQALLFYIGEERYALPINNVKKIVKLKTDEIKLVQNKEVWLMDETIVPIVRLDKVLGVPRESQPENTVQTVVVVNKGDKLYGLTVDRLVGQQEIVIKNIGKYLSNIRTISGATILGDGKVALILDINYIAQ